MTDLVMEWVLLGAVLAAMGLTVWALVDAWRDLTMVVRSRNNGIMLRLAWGAVRAEGIRLVLLVVAAYIALELLGLSVIQPEWRRPVLVGAFTVIVGLQALKLLAMRKDRQAILGGRDRGGDDDAE